MCGYEYFNTLCKEEGCDTSVIINDKRQTLCELARQQCLGWGMCGTIDRARFRAPMDMKSSRLRCNASKEEHQERRRRYENEQVAEEMAQEEYERAAYRRQLEAYERELQAYEQAQARAREELERDAQQREDQMNASSHAYGYGGSYYDDNTGGSSGQGSSSDQGSNTYGFRRAW